MKLCCLSDFTTEEQYNYALFIEGLNSDTSKHTVVINISLQDNPGVTTKHDL